MTKQPETEYWRLIAESINVEDRKLQFAVRHNPSRGIGRESILRGVLVSQTPEPYRVKTGFVAHISKERVISDQCDILVYDPTLSQPFYRIDEFVVVPFQAARLAIEVRSKLDVRQQRVVKGTKERKRSKGTISGLEQMFKVCKSMRKLPFPTRVFGFAYSGVKFDAFVAAIATRVEGDIFRVPECIAVHNNNYICVRVTERFAKPNRPAPDPRLCIAIDFSQNKMDTAGLATAYFLNLYIERVKEGPVPAFAIESVGELAQSLKIPDSAIKIIDEKGQIRPGPINI